MTETDYIKARLREEGIVCNIHNNGLQFNALDSDGDVQTYYPSRGTIVLHKDGQIRSLREETLDEFISLLHDPSLIEARIREETEPVKAEDADQYSLFDMI